jgi:hypothetical protein
MNDPTRTHGLRPLNPCVSSPKSPAECPWSFVSEVNGYRYCREPGYVERWGHSPYCPPSIPPMNTLVCPWGFVHRTTPQLTLDEFCDNQRPAVNEGPEEKEDSPDD